jgi:hypothetical protein
MVVANNPQHHGKLEQHAGNAAAATPKDVIIPELADSLEWVLSSPPNVHQFDEPPVSLLLCAKSG